MTAALKLQVKLGNTGDHMSERRSRESYVCKTVKEIKKKYLFLECGCSVPISTPDVPHFERLVVLATLVF